MTFLNSAPPRGRLALIVATSLVLVAAVAFAALFLVQRVERDAALFEVETRARSDAQILANGLRSELSKFELVPRVLAEDLEVAAVVQGDRGTRRALDRRLERIAEQTGAAALYVMDADGLTLAASNWNLPTSFVGSNYAFRGYFRDALAQGEASQFALGTVSRAPGLYIAHSIVVDGRPRGVVALKVEFDEAEQVWRDSGVRAFVSDAEGIVLIASDPAWRFTMLQRFASAGRDAAADERQYGVAGFRRFAPDIPDAALVSVPVGYPAQGTAEEWNLHLLAETGPQVAAAQQTARLEVLLGLVALALVLWAAFQWRRHRQAQTRSIIAARTATLREQLTQANRLATLGQVTAGVGHEIRQPLAASRLFAENGQRMIAAGDTGGAADNFAHIAGLMERIGQITDELLRFSRRTAREPGDVQLARAIDGAMLLLRDRIEQSGVTIERPSSSLAETIVRAEPVRLEQVLVNLLQNALDAVGEGGRIEITIACDANFARLSVLDDGPGLTREEADQLFQPFATTKPDGLGLGLVISLDIMQGLDGDLVVEPSGDGGRFTMVIPLA
ncbi:ATP-binding protein [Aurantiacibacter luteus]|uniref:histidine kinase n=1 Tax=Aurantiacibacter luteus TaxID=1581420 RepID=A0A0G9MT10_9SPHN|nr:ATP-binding protein [Aurantiacibacter luteus]KLE33865.1 hypothetical protein AAW00_12395 [Aurantiacibacter luteus]